MLSRSTATDSEFHQWHEMHDAEIWNSFREGSWAALEYIYRTYTKDLFNYGMKICAHSNLVEDAIQELFVELWNSRENLAGTEKIKFYLLKALKWKIAHQRKRERKIYGEQTLEDVMEVQVVLPFESKSLSDQLSEEKRACLYKAINKLPHRQKEILQLLFFEGLSHQEVAEIMNIRVRSVYVTACRALASLRKNLQHHGAKILIHWAVFMLALSEIKDLF